MMFAKHRSRTRGSRGVIAIVTGATIFFVVTLSVVMAELGLSALQRFEMHDAAEAMAMAQGYQVLTQPSPGFGGDIPVEPVIGDNARPSSYNQPGREQKPIPVYAGPTRSADDAGGEVVTMHGVPAENFMEGVGTPLSVGGNARVVVNQYQVENLTPVPARILLVVDYSRSMRLPYPGGGLSARTILQNAINNIINDPKLDGRVDWGILLFSDTNGSGTSPLGPPAVYDPAQVANNRTKIETQVAEPTFGNGTDIAGAIKAGIGILNKPQGDIRYGKNVMIIIADGEPDVDPALGPNAEYQALVDSASGKAIDAAHDAWAQGIQTISVLIQRQTTLAADADKQFMQKIAGDGTFGGPTAQNSDNAGVADKEGGLGDFLSMINPANHCLSANPIIPPKNSWMPVPTEDDGIYGFLVPSGTGRDEKVVKRVWSNKNMDPAPVGGTFKDDEKDYKFYFDPKTSIIELNATICLKFLQGPKPVPTFRARYGLPRISWVGSM